MSSKQPIIIIGPAHPLRGGIAQLNESLARELQKKGEIVQIESFYLQYPKALFPGDSQFTEDPAPEDVEIHSSLSSIDPRTWYSVARKVIKAKPKFVVIRFWIPFMGPALGTLARRIKKAGIPVIGIVDNAIPHESRPGDKSLSKYFFKNCDGFFTLSSSVAEDLNQLAPGKPTTTSPHPVYDHFGEIMPQAEARRTLGLEENGKYVLFFGFVRKYKGLDLLLEALALCKTEDVELVIAGEYYEAKSKYDELIDQLGITERVIAHNRFIAEADVKLYFSACNLVAQTYHTATQSGVTQIAYHFHKPMLVTNVGGLGEIVKDGENGFVVEKHPNAIANAIDRYFQEGLESEYSESVAKHKHIFSWEHFTEALLKFSEELK